MNDLVHILEIWRELSPLDRQRALDGLRQIEAREKAGKRKD